MFNDFKQSDPLFFKPHKHTSKLCGTNTEFVNLIVYTVSTVFVTETVEMWQWTLISSAREKWAWNYNFTPSYLFISWRLMKHGDKFNIFADRRCCGDVETWVIADRVYQDAVRIHRSFRRKQVTTQVPYSVYWVKELWLYLFVRIETCRSVPRSFPQTAQLNITEADSSHIVWLGSLVRHWYSPISWVRWNCGARYRPNNTAAAAGTASWGRP